MYAEPQNRAPHGWLRNLSSRLAGWVFVLALGNRHLGRFNSFRLIQGEIARGVAGYCGANVYLDVALSWVVAHARHCPVELRGERGRATGYTPRRLLGHFWQLVVTSGTRPLRLIALLGASAIVFAVAISALVVWRRLENEVPVQGWTSTIIVVCLFAGLILVSLGVVVSGIIGMAVVVLVVYQGIEPLLERVDLHAAAVPSWVHLVPAAWFAHLPTVWSGVSPEAQPGIFLAGLGVLVVCAVPASRFLAPSYGMNRAEVHAVEGSRAVPSAAPAASRWRRLGALPRALATASLGGDPLRRAGFDFVLAHLRGDRRLRLSLIPVLAMPVVYVVFGLSASGGWDPYSNESNTTTFANRRAVVALFGAGHLFVMLAVVTVRSLASSPEWRAAWVFFAAPTRRFDAFQGGVLCGAFYGLLLPALILVLVPLWVVWRDPVHAMAHIAVPLGVALLSAAVVLVGDAAVPFAREPLPHERAFSWVAGFLVLVPLVALAAGTMRMPISSSITRAGPVSSLPVLTRPPTS